MNKDEILKLHELDADEQSRKLMLSGVMKRKLCPYCGKMATWGCNACDDRQSLYESLADCAFRLRDEVVKIDWVLWQIACAKVYEAVKPFRELESKHKEYSPGYFGNRAKPIHWVEAALWAKAGE